jgi:hypothetical protein
MQEENSIHIKLVHENGNIFDATLGIDCDEIDDLIDFIDYLIGEFMS